MDELKPAGIADLERLAQITRSPDPAVVELVKAARGMKAAYEALLAMKAEDPTRFKEPGSRHHALTIALALFKEIMEE